MGVYDAWYSHIGDEENFGFFYWLLCSFAFYLWFIRAACMLHSSYILRRPQNLRTLPIPREISSKIFGPLRKFLTYFIRFDGKNLTENFYFSLFFITQRKTKQFWHLKNDPCSDMEQQISQGYLSAFIFVFYPGGGHYKNIQHVKGRRR